MADCPHCGAVLDTGVRHCSSGTCDWLVCVCGAVVAWLQGFHTHVKAKSRECKAGS